MKYEGLPWQKKLLKVMKDKVISLFLEQAIYEQKVKQDPKHRRDSRPGYLQHYATRKETGDDT
jgi:hypothetical protein